MDKPWTKLELEIVKIHSDKMEKEIKKILEDCGFERSGRAVHWAKVKLGITKETRTPATPQHIIEYIKTSTLNNVELMKELKEKFGFNMDWRVVRLFRNAVRCREITIFGERKRVSEWAKDKRCEVTEDTIRSRLRRGIEGPDLLKKSLRTRVESNKTKKIIKMDKEGETLSKIRKVVGKLPLKKYWFITKVNNVELTEEQIERIKKQTTEWGLGKLAKEMKVPFSAVFRVAWVHAERH